MTSATENEELNRIIHRVSSEKPDRFLSRRNGPLPLSLNHNQPAEIYFTITAPAEGDRQLFRGLAAFLCCKKLPVPFPKK
jgi:hypothetical protein